MKRNKLFVLLGIVLLVSTFSCKKVDDEIVPNIVSVDFGEGKYKEPFRGPLSSHPQWLVATLDWPIIRNLRPDTLVLTKTIEIGFNEDAVRSHATANIIFVDDSCNRLEGIKVYCNDIPVGDEGYVVEASPLKKECTETGYFIVSGVELDEVNNIKLFSDSPQSVADWKCSQIIGWPLLLWLLWLIMALIVLAIVIAILYLIIKGIVSLIGKTSSGGQAVGAMKMPRGKHAGRKNNKQKKEKRKDGNKKDAYFLPWVGKNYESSMFGKRVLALGESFYCHQPCIDCGASQHPECVRAIIDRVGYYLDGRDGVIEKEKWMNTYLKFERSLVNHETDSQESHAIWDNIAFYDYLQEAMGGPRVLVSPELYEASAEAFSKVMDQLQPDLIIVWGTQLWSKLSIVHGVPSGKIYKVDNEMIVHADYYLSNGKVSHIIRVQHPSTGYDWEYWNKVIKVFL